MKFLNQLLYIICVFGVVVSCQKKEITEVPRPENPGKLTATKGDTSVFLKWDAVPSADSYVLVRGLKVLAANIKTLSFEDASGPDTTTEYRLYAVNKEGWRSYRYAVDSGYTAIPKGVLPRPPQVLKATTSDIRYVTLDYAGAKFATAYNIYRDGVLIAAKVKTTTFNDSSASVTNAVYKVQAVNNNGVSIAFAAATGKKALVYDGSFDNTTDGTVIAPWTFVADRIGFYTEGDPKVTSGVGENNTKGLRIVSGKIQILYDWGGVKAEGKYKVSMSLKKADGGFWISPNFSAAEHVGATGDWKKISVITPKLPVGGTFNVKVEPYGSDPALIDNWTIEYLAK